MLSLLQTPHKTLDPIGSISVYISGESTPTLLHCGILLL